MAKNKPVKVQQNLKNIENISFNTIKPPNYDLKKPIFSFHDIKYQSRNCISNCEKEDQIKIINTLLKLSQRTWQEIKTLPRENGYELIPIEKMKIAIPPGVSKEVDLFIFRFSKKGRFAGYRFNEILHIVGVGPNHDLY